MSAADNAKSRFIALATDRNFVELSGVLIRSICAKGNIPDAKILVYADRLTKKEKRQLASCADRPVEIIDVDGALRRRISGLKSTYNWTAATWLRLLAPELTAPASGRLLYLDCDIVVNDDLRPLFDIDLASHPIAAFHEVANGFFNAGVLMIDLAKWRAANITAKTIDYARAKGDELVYLDQEALNAVIGLDYLPLDSRWNLQRREATAFATAAIVHFTGMKPDHAECQNPARVLYLEHRAYTPWANKPLRSKLQRRARRYRDKIKALPKRIFRELMLPRKTRKPAPQ